MTKTSLASVALLTEAEAARAFNMGTTRFKARCASRTGFFPSKPLYRFRRVR
jgi:hypothetical protein